MEMPRIVITLRVKLRGWIALHPFVLFDKRMRKNVPEFFSLRGRASILSFPGWSLGTSTGRLLPPQ
ncbi:MAG TPA: hypothetical protein DDW76_36795 [Cyanobacteria bacterium UBA11369]|nr:hypothetical protein [Cyanobacteria bacterium UBA11371]HBE35360.1 hypothetical protein [Cyanobacteria bacterium UBA11368]HBE54164.1 hypothetical protein [Cyanobacteria bacterium UBA11369]